MNLLNASFFILRVDTLTNETPQKKKKITYINLQANIEHIKNSFNRLHQSLTQPIGDDWKMILNTVFYSRLTNIVKTCHCCTCITMWYSFVPRRFLLCLDIYYLDNLSGPTNQSLLSHKITNKRFGWRKII